MPNTWRTEIFMSGRADVFSDVASMKTSLGLRLRGPNRRAGLGPRTAFLSFGPGPAQFRRRHNARAPGAVRSRRALARRAGGSAEARGLEGVVGPDDVAQALLEGAVAAMGVGVEALHQRLVLRLDARQI